MQLFQFPVLATMAAILPGLQAFDSRLPAIRRRAAACLRLAMLAALGLLSGSAASAQAAHVSAHVSGETTQITLPAPGLQSAYAIAVDQNNNVYVVDPFTPEVVKLTPSGGSFVELVIANAANGLVNPSGIAVDGNGAVYIFDNEAGLLKETPSDSCAGCYTQSVISTAPRTGGSLYIAVDGSLSLYLSGGLNGANGNICVKLPWNGASYGSAVSLNCGFLSWGIALGEFGILELVDYNTGNLWAISSSFPYTKQQQTSGLNHPEGVAVNGSTVYVANTGTSQVVQETLNLSGPSEGTYTASTVPLVSPSFSGPLGVALDGNGNLYVADGGEAIEVTESNGSFGTVNVGSTSTNPINVQFTFDSPGTLGSIAAVTQGATGLDFANAGTGTCTAGTIYTAGQSCIVQVSFTPTAAGARYGAVELLNQSGNIIATAFVSGVGQGPLIAYSPDTEIAIDPTVNAMPMVSPWGIALDGAGDLFMADYTQARVVEVPFGGGPAIAIDPTVNAQSLIVPSGLAVDGAGDLFIGDVAKNRTGGRVVEVPAGGGAAIAIDPTVNGLPLNGPSGLAVDGAGDLFIADEFNGRVVEVPANGGTPIAIDPSVNAQSLIHPTCVAVDSSGDLFIGDFDIGRVVEVPAGGGTAIAIAPTVNGLQMGWISGVAVDAAGDLFISDSQNARVVKVPGGGGSPVAIAPTVNGIPVFEPGDVAVDSIGDLLIGDYFNRVVEIQGSLNVSYTFPTATLAGENDTADGPYTVNIQNVGNQPLIFANNPSYPAGFPENSADPNLCAANTEVYPGTACDVSVNFNPPGIGATSGSVLLIDNVLNYVNASQSVVLSGTGLPVPAALTSPTPSSVLSGSSVNFTWSAGVGVSHYWLTVGTGTSGASSKSIYAGAPTTALSATVTGLPIYGQAVYATLSSEINGAWQSTVYPFTAYGSPVAAALTAPTPNSQFASSSVTFTWNAGGGVANYWLNLGTAASGTNAKNIYSSGSVTALSKTVTGLPTNGEAIYATLYSYIGGAFQPTVYAFYATGPAVLISPSPSTKLAASTTFTWSAGTGITNYWLNLGTADAAANSKNLYNSGPIKTLTATVTGIPQYGETLYATLYSYIAGAWQPIVYPFTAAGAPVAAALTTPTPGSKLTSSSVTYTWSAGEGVNYYWLNLGTTNSGAGAKNLYSGGSTTLTSATVTGLPTNGETIYATLYSYIAGVWEPTVYTYIASGSPTPAAMTAPAPGSTFTSSSVTFTWSPSNPATSYWLNVGTAPSGPAAKNIFTSGPTTLTTITLGIPSGGEAIYATLYTEIGGVWQPTVYSYTAQ
jgi:sugar lactone lactonase YvrE